MVGEWVVGLELVARRERECPGGKLGLEAAGGVEVDALVGLSVANFQRVPGSCLPVPVDLPAQAGYGLPGSPGAGVRVPAGDVPYIGYAQLRQQGLAVAQTCIC